MATQISDNTVRQFKHLQALVSRLGTPAASLFSPHTNMAAASMQTTAVVGIQQTVAPNITGVIPTISDAAASEKKWYLFTVPRLATAVLDASDLSADA